MASERITVQEAHDLGLLHVPANMPYVWASPTRRSIITDDGWPTGFIRTKSGWRVYLYDSYMAGSFRRRTDWIPYETWLSQRR